MQAIHTEITREVNTLLGRIFAERKQTGGMDPEAVEMGFRAVLHQAGAAALTQLLQFPEPVADERLIPCPCGHQARYRELRSRRLLSALGEVELSRPWYLCPHCHKGQFPLDRQLDVENRDCSPGVRRIRGSDFALAAGRRGARIMAKKRIRAMIVENNEATAYLIKRALVQNAGELRTMNR